MALNKKQASTMTRVFIGIVAVILVISFVPGLFGLFGSDPTATPQGSGALDSIAAKYSQRVAFNQNLLQSEPTSYTVLLDQAWAYHDWGTDVRESNVQQGAELPMLTAAKTFYERALSVDDADPAVRTDYAIVLSFLGDQQSAIQVVEQVIEENPGFALAYFNAGEFYSAVGRTGDALAAYQRYLEIDPQGQASAAAQSRIEGLQSAGAAPAPAPGQSSPATGTP